MQSFWRLVLKVEPPADRRIRHTTSGGIDMGISAKQIIDIMAGWVGLNRSNGTHKPIIEAYNSYIRSHPGSGRSYTLSMKDDYCDAAISAAFIKCNAVELIGGVECGVEEHINIFKKKGIWNEDGTITPKPGDIICYNWDDSTQPNNGYADHIGIVERVDESNKTMVVIEGNTNGGKVGRHTIPFGYGYIRGFACPEYTKGEEANKTNSSKGEVYMFEVKMVQKGAAGNDVKLLQRLLKSHGCKGKDGKSLKIDGSCGDNTVYAIREYQKKKKLEVDGCAGAATWKSILLR